jgi:hypothetical protein
VIPGIIAVISTVWFLIGGVIDLRRMFHDLEVREINNLDNGMVEGHISLADKSQLDKIDKASSSQKNCK